ncbi:cystathionine beta-lyase [Pararhodobacter oceanensis]|uniref:Cystathionine beta-lyase n=1 Tax=Pararhodobacter oceanensis TaxID=2172121 RepID=A0A2T8HXT5_9RHOB|nr:cystathionine beta-lyase [Pararhodobacter oceanensis]PVH30238.1 cystathionine beta-lyase [Pararhodobacter oceanensis]
MTRRIASTLAQTGRPHGSGITSVNPPLVRASTFVFDKLEDFEIASKTPFDVPFYGRVGTPTTFAFEEAMAELEGAHRSIATSSGVSAISAVLLAFLQQGDHLLVVDTVYEPVRRFCSRMLTRMDVETTFYDPAIGAGIADLIRPETKLIYLESPGSGTFDVQDIPAIVAAAKAAGIHTAIDNTWATPLLYRPLEHGVDVSIHAATKYIVGHSDAMLGVISTNAETYDAVRRASQDLGACAGIEECNLGLRGLRTLQVRLERHAATGLVLAEWLAAQPQIARVLHPALPSCPGHAHWKRDFDGAAGLFSVELTSRDPQAKRAFIDALEMFKIGFSWGGYESLVLPMNPAARELSRWQELGPVVRLQVGLEDPQDLLEDLQQALAKLPG